MSCQSWDPSLHLHPPMGEEMGAVATIHNTIHNCYGIKVDASKTLIQS